MRERVGHTGVWDAAVSIHASIWRGHFGVQSYPPKDRFGFLIPAELLNTTWGLPALPRLRRGVPPAPGTSRRHHPRPPNPPELLGMPGKTRKN